MTITMDFGNVYITNQPYKDITGDTLDDTSYVVVRIDQQKLDDTFTKTLNQFNIPVSPVQINAGTAELDFIDMKNVGQVIAVTGVLCSELGSTALSKKTNLFQLAGYGNVSYNSLMTGLSPIGGNVCMVWGLVSNGTRQKVWGNITQIMVSESPGLYHDGTATDDKSRVKFDVQLKFNIGLERRQRSDF